MDLISASRAANILGIKVETLYAYVSRGLINSFDNTESGKRAKLYAHEDVLALKARGKARSGHGAVAAAALHWGDPVLDSAITRITPEGPIYRGYLATDLAERGVLFENVAEMLWSGILSDPPIAWPYDEFKLTLEPLKQSPLRLRDPNQFVLQLLPYVLHAYALSEGDPDLSQLDSMLPHARRLIWCITKQLFLLRKGARDQAIQPGMTIAQAIAAATLPRTTEKAVSLINHCLVMAIDHELTSSTFAARVASSTGAGIIGSLSAAYGTLAGTKHGGVFTFLETLLDQVAEGGANRVMRQFKQRGQEVLGFRHALYPKGDPRGASIVNAAMQLEEKFEEFVFVKKLIAAADKAGFGPPAIDTAMLLAAAGLGLPRGSAAAIFGIARTAGLVAHIMEQRMSGFMVRPRARYNGR